MRYHGNKNGLEEQMNPADEQPPKIMLSLTLSDGKGVNATSSCQAVS